MTWAEQALPLLHASLVADDMEPLLVYWSCYRALKATADGRAEQVLQIAHGLVTDVAARIADPALRASYLNIGAHREIERLIAEQATDVSVSTSR